MELIGVSEITAMIAVLAYVALAFTAGISDILTLSIPNRYSAAIVLLYPSYVISTGQPVDWSSALLLALIALSLGFALFVGGLWGGGDAKFLGAVALWAGPDGFLELVFTTALAGGVISVFILLQYYLPHAIASGFFRYRAALPRLRAQPVPYGVAISIGALYGAFTLLKVS